MAVHLSNVHQILISVPTRLADILMRNENGRPLQCIGDGGALASGQRLALAKWGQAPATFSKWQRFEGLAGASPHFWSRGREMRRHVMVLIKMTCASGQNDVRS